MTAPAPLHRALAIEPADAETWERLAFVAVAAGDMAGAALAFARALARRWSAPGFSNLAELRRAAGLPGADRAARRALVLDPALPAAHTNRGNLLMHADRLHAAAAVFARAFALDPDAREAVYNRAAALAATGEPIRALGLYDALIARFPDFFEAHWNRALALLAAGRWREGWQAHELRRHHPDLAPRRFPIPGWDGGPLGGRRILLAAEQGLGDTLQFLRYVPEVIGRGGRVVLDVQAPLLGLARTIPGLDALIASGTPVPPVDLEAPLMSLPLLLGPEAPPPAPPYLHADPARRAHWRRELARDPRPRVGVAWAGNPQHRYDRRRSLDAAALAILAGVTSVRFVSLQKERGAPAGWLDVAPDFADAAALIAECDLVIAVDTAIAHLAGALGRPLWVLLSPGVDWRWPQGARTPWYPDARQIWQRADEAPDWRPTIRRLAAHLRGNFEPGSAPP